MRSTDKKTDEIKRKIINIEIECQKHRDIIERENVKKDMLDLLNIVKRYTASYYYYENTKGLSEEEALRALNRRIKFPEIEKKIDSFKGKIQSLKNEIKDSENSFLSKIFKKTVQEEIVNKKNEISDLENKYKRTKKLFICIQNGRVLLNNYFKTCNKLGMLNARLNWIREKQELDFQEFKKHELAYAKAASLDLKTRQQAEKVKREIFSQLRKFPLCPYCQNDLGDTPHADHIYPVVKGGLSTIENMVYICADCNRKKSDLTLREFIIKYNLERDQVEKILNKLSKRF